MHPPKSKTSSSIPKVVKSNSGKDGIDEMIVIRSPAVPAAENSSTDGPVTPARGRTLLDLKKRNGNKSGSKRPSEHEKNIQSFLLSDYLMKRRMIKLFNMHLQSVQQWHREIMLSSSDYTNQHLT
ncbi:hypothetical protein V6N13_121182 [Hibiscus sabdariffa]|uniref:Uncharacterized protein n=2 Tax=Hibiscus sabdariffa TaxID=183260 RepID=A0ABR2EA18_9ROSI